MNINFIIVWMMIIFGGLVGMVGVEVVLGLIFGVILIQLFIGLVGIIGFDVIMVVLLGCFKLFGIVFVGLFWGVMNQGGLCMQVMIQIFLDFVWVIQVVIVMFVVVLMLVKMILFFFKMCREKCIKKCDCGLVLVDIIMKGVLV